MISGCAGAVPEGPLSLLRRAMQLQLSVRVVTRHARGVRGVATGMLHTHLAAVQLTFSQLLI